MAELLFFSSLALVVYTYFGYPLAVFLLGALFERKVVKSRSLFSVSVILSAYNEEKYIGAKIKNLLEQDYPQDRVEILVGSDGSTDRTDEIVNEFRENRVKLIRFDERSGKPAVLNRLASMARGDILVFADARQLFEKNSVSALAANFSDKSVGCASGELVLRNAQCAPFGKGVMLYWKYEKFIRNSESRLDSMLGATGAIYAIRKTLYSPPDPDIILDDMYIPLRITEMGYRAVFDPAALAYDEVSGAYEKESARKTRTLAGNWQLAARMPSVLNPFRSRTAFQFISHKFFRLIAFFFLIILFLSNIMLLRFEFYGYFFALQAAFYILALARLFMKDSKNILFNVPYAFCALNYDAVKGLAAFIAGKSSSKWTKAGQ